MGLTGGYRTLEVGLQGSSSSLFQPFASQSTLRCEEPLPYASTSMEPFLLYLLCSASLSLLKFRAKISLVSIVYFVTSTRKAIVTNGRTEINFPQYLVVVQMPTFLATTRCRGCGRNGSGVDAVVMPLADEVIWKTTVDVIPETCKREQLRWIYMLLVKNKPSKTQYLRQSVRMHFPHFHT